MLSLFKVICGLSVRGLWHLMSVVNRFRMLGIDVLGYLISVAFEEHLAFLSLSCSSSYCRLIFFLHWLGSFCLTNCLTGSLYGAKSYS